MQPSELELDVSPNARRAIAVSSAAETEMEIGKLHQQLKKEYEYVEGLRKHLRIAESR